MGIYSRYMEPEYDVQANESYVGTLGCMQCIIDIERENHAIFEEVLADDFLDAYYLQEGYEMVIHEGAVETIFTRIKTFLKKIWEKIKGIFSTFIKKLDTVIIRDNKKFVEKYQREVRTKNLSKLKYKYCKPTGKLPVIRAAVDGMEMQKEVDKMDKSISPWNRDFSYIKKVKDMVSDGEYFDHLCDVIIPDVKTDYQSMTKDIHEFCYESEESEEGLDSSRLTSIILDLQGDKTKSEVEKTVRTVNKYFKDINKEIDRLSKEILNYKGKDEDLIQFVNNESVMIIQEVSKKTRNKKKKQRQNKNQNNNQDEEDYSNYDSSSDMGGMYGGDNDEDKIANDNDKRSYQDQQRINRNKNSAIMKAKDVRDVLLPLINAFQQAISQMESFHTKIVACFLNEHKFGITQSRKVFARAVSYNDKAKNESVYLDAVEEAAEYEINEMFEQYCL